MLIEWTFLIGSGLSGSHDRAIKDTHKRLPVLLQIIAGMMG